MVLQAALVDLVVRGVLAGAWAAVVAVALQAATAQALQPAGEVAAVLPVHLTAGRAAVEEAEAQDLVAEVAAVSAADQSAPAAQGREAAATALRTKKPA